MKIGRIPPSWRKIQQAIDFNAKGRNIAILAEDAWANALCSL